MRYRQSVSVILGLAALCEAIGCVDRTLTVSTHPEGGLVYFNGQEAGRSSMTHTFIWYGDYDITIRKEGYQTLRRRESVSPPIYQIVPLDLIAELIPYRFHDDRYFTFELTPEVLPQEEDPALLARAEDFRKLLRGTQLPPGTHHPPQATPATRPVHHPKKHLAASETAPSE